MKLDQLRYFQQVAALRSFSRAARALHISQPAVTRQIRLLEEELGVQLLLRHSRGIQVTAAGARLAKAAEEVLQGLERVQREVKAESSAPSGVLRLGFPPSIGYLLIGSAVSRYLAKYPDVTVHLVEGFSHMLREWLLADRIDMAVMTTLSRSPNLLAQPLYTEDIWMVRCPREPGEPNREVTLEELVSHPLIQTNRSNIMRQMLEEAAAARSLPLNVIIEAEAMSVITDLARRGVGAHASPYSAVMNDIKRGELAGGPIRGLSLSRVLVHRHDRPLTPAAAEMKVAINEALADAIAAEGPSVRKD